MTPPAATAAGVQLERRLRQLDPLDVVLALTTRLALAIDRLRRIAGECAGCGGIGETVTYFEAFTMTDHPSLLAGVYAYQRRARIKLEGSRVEKQPRAAATLWTPCALCADTRETIRICEASE